MSDSASARISSNRRRAVNLFRGSPPGVPATWRCTNEHCGVWVQPSKASTPDRCHVCDEKRK